MTRRMRNEALLECVNAAEPLRRLMATGSKPALPIHISFYND